MGGGVGGGDGGVGGGVGGGDGGVGTTYPPAMIPNRKSDIMLTSLP